MAFGQTSSNKLRTRNFATRPERWRTGSLPRISRRKEYRKERKERKEKHINISRGKERRTRNDYKNSPPPRKMADRLLTTNFTKKRIPLRAKRTQRKTFYYIPRERRGTRNDYKNSPPAQKDGGQAPYHEFHEEKNTAKSEKNAKKNILLYPAGKKGGRGMITKIRLRPERRRTGSLPRISRRKEYRKECKERKEKHIIISSA
ncbi:MAG: hypothetical protein PHN88_08375 [Ignavibacteria bacterium]|nr:hypothetical protein [Ignavibacteria bacterium]